MIHSGQETHANAHARCSLMFVKRTTDSFRLCDACAGEELTFAVPPDGFPLCESTPQQHRLLGPGFRPPEDTAAGRRPTATPPGRQRNSCCPAPTNAWIIHPSATPKRTWQTRTSLAERAQGLTRVFWLGPFVKTASLSRVTNQQTHVRLRWRFWVFVFVSRI